MAPMSMTIVTPLHVFLAGIVIATAAAAPPAPPAPPPEGVVVDVSAHRPVSGVSVRQVGTTLHVRWPIQRGQHGVLVLQLQPDRPLIEELGLAKTADAPCTPLLRQVNPVTF